MSFLRFFSRRMTDQTTFADRYATSRHVLDDERYRREVLNLLFGILFGLVFETRFLWKYVE